MSQVVQKSVERSFVHFKLYGGIILFQASIRVTPVRFKVKIFGARLRDLSISRGQFLNPHLGSQKIDL